MAAKTLRILHLSDLHCGMDGFSTLWPNTRAAFFEDLESLAKRGQPWDIVLFTGDLTQTGSPPEFTAFSEILRKLWKHLNDLDSDPELVAIPGNHDLVRPSKEVAAARVLRAWSTDDELRRLFWRSTDNEYRLLVKKAFDAFQSWRLASPQHAVVQEGLLPGDVSLSRHINGINIGIVGLNTSFLQLTSGSYRGKLALDLRQLHGVCGNDPPEWCAGHDVNILMTHHPADWLDGGARDSFFREMFDPRRFDIHMFGHMHEAAHQLTSTGGSPPRHEFQSASLFGLENWESDTGIAHSRSHGYIDITIEVTDQARRVTCRPRLLETSHPKLPIRMVPNQRDFCLNDAGEYVVTLPPTESRRRISNAPRRISSVRRCTVDRVTQVGGVSLEDWRTLLTQLDLIRADAATISRTGPVELVDPGGSTLVHCIAAAGVVLSEREVETINTRVERSEFQGVVVVALAELDESARVAAAQFARRKQFDLWDPVKVGRALVARLPAQSSHLTTLDGALVEAECLLVGGRALVAISDRTRHAWFYVIDELGNILPEGSSEIAAVRANNINYLAPTYGPLGEASSEVTSRAKSFDRQAYLAHAVESHGTLKYSAVSPVGFMFPHGQLLDIYVAANADVALGSTDPKQDLLNAVFETVDLTDAQKKQLEQLVVSRERIIPSETDYAQRLYQQFRSVLVLGDPGSGKTCFVKNEVLSYCNPQSSWYRYHLPLYLSLAEVGPRLDESTDIHTIAVAILNRQGYVVDKPTIDALFSQGLLAYFFDGFDEVVSLEHRAHLLKVVSKLIADGLDVGNRFVLTSRPAAVHRVKMPDALKVLQLRGLTDQEMRLLAHNVVRAEFVRGGERIRFSQSTEHGQALVDRLMADCASSPGIGRLARNPLLLTLLIMIHANSGALAAKRHRVYAQAVTTLVSIRNRSDGKFAHSEADLRSRLGRIAMGILTSERGPMTRSEAIAAVEEAIRALGRAPELDEADQFIQSVAEATGLLVVSRDTAGTETVSFMHHSFVEYYAAIALAIGADPASLQQYASKARWRDVVTLSVGLLSDHSDVTPSIAAMCSVDDVERVVCDRLRFAVECSLECDVPPDGTQRVIAQSIHACLANGAGRVDPSLRARLASLVARMLTASGSPHVVDMMRSGLAAADGQTCAAFVDFIGRVSTEGTLHESLYVDIDRCAARPEPVVRVALVATYHFAAAFRRAPVSALVLPMLARRGSEAQSVAASCVASFPELAASAGSLMESLVASPNFSTAVAASRWYLEALESAKFVIQNRHVVDQALRVWEAFARVSSSARLNLRLDNEVWRVLTQSDDVKVRAIGLRLLPWQQDGEVIAHELLMRAVRQMEREARLAALGAMLYSEHVRRLLKDSDIDQILAVLDEQGDARRSAFRLLTKIRLDDRRAETLLGYLESADWAFEREAVYCLAEHANQRDAARVLFFRRAIEVLLRRAGPVRSWESRVGVVLTASLRVSGTAPREFLREAMTLVATPTLPPTLRRAAVRAACHGVQTRPESLNRALEWLRTSDARLWTAVAVGVGELVQRGSEIINWGAEVRLPLVELEAMLAARWHELAFTVTGAIADQDCSSVRQSLEDVHGAIAAMAT